MGMRTSLKTAIIGGENPLGIETKSKSQRSGGGASRKRER